jgi:hypothetical protein
MALAAAVSRAHLVQTPDCFKSHRQEIQAYTHVATASHVASTASTEVGFRISVFEGEPELALESHRP